MPGCHKFLSLLAVASLVVACSSVSERQQQDHATVNLQWPALPQAARIKYLYSISEPTDLGIRKGFWAKTWQFVKGTRQSNTLVKPMGVHVDSDGRILVVDSHRQKIHVYDDRQSEYYSFPTEPLDNFTSPVDITTDGSGRVFVTDSVAGQVHVFSDHGKKYLRALGADFLQRPTGITMRNAGRELLIVDTLAAKIMVLNSSDFSVQQTVGSEGVGSNALHYPTSITATDDGSVLVTDSLNFRIQFLDDQFNFVNSLGAAGDVPGYFSRPKGVAVDSDGHIYVVDALFDNVQVFNRQGELLMAIGSSGNAAGEFWLPNEIFIDAADRIYVSDTYNARVQVFQYLGGGEQ